MQNLKTFKEIHEELSSSFGAGTSSVSTGLGVAGSTHGYDKPLFNKKGKAFDVSSANIWETAGTRGTLDPTRVLR